MMGIGFLVAVAMGEEYQWPQNRSGLSGKE
jgi:hypothetical protein